MFQNEHQTNEHIPLSARTSVIVFRGKTSALDLQMQKASTSTPSACPLPSPRFPCCPPHPQLSWVASARPFHLPRQGPLNATTAGAFQHSPPRLALDLN